MTSKLANPTSANLVMIDTQGRDLSVDDPLWRSICWAEQEARRLAFERECLQQRIHAYKLSALELQALRAEITVEQARRQSIEPGAFLAQKAVS
jgi:hypothetical protein